MKKLFYFVMVTLVFTAIQDATVGAQEGDPDMVEPPFCDGEPCDLVMEAPLEDPDMLPEEDHRRLPAPEDMGKFFEYDQEYQTNGVLSQASYDELSEDGYTKKRVDWILTQIKELLLSRGGG